MAEETPMQGTAAARRNFVARQWHKFWQPVSEFEGWQDAESKLLDETAKTIRRTMLTLIAFSFFCLVVISLSDESLAKGTVTVPLVNVEVALTDFLLLGPLILTALVVYLHIYIGYWHGIPADHRATAPPFLFTMNSLVSRLITAFTFYWLVPVVLWLFAYKVGPHNAFAALLLPFLLVGAVAVLCWLQFKRTPVEARRWWPKLRSVGGLAVSVPAFLFFSIVQGPDLLLAIYGGAVVVAQAPGTTNLASTRPQPPAAANGDDGRTALTQPPPEPEPTPSPPTSRPARPSTPAPPAPSRVARVLLPSLLPPFAVSTPSTPDIVQTVLGLKRGLDLAGADLRKVDLNRRDLRGANLRGADLSGVSLSLLDLAGADLTDADLSLANLTGANLIRANLARANLTGADIRLAIGLNCSQLRRARNWQRAYRDKKLACGEPIPKPPAKAR